MSDRKQFRIPQTGDVWKHYKGDFYTVIGMGVSSAGTPTVIYTEFEWNKAGQPPLYTRPLGEWLDMVDAPRIVLENSASRPKIERFSYDSLMQDKVCDYLPDTHR